MAIRKIFLNEMETFHKYIKIKDVAQATDIDETMLSKFFNYRNELSFLHALKVIRFIAGEKEDELMEKFIRYLMETDQKLNLRCAMEYLYCHGKMELLKELISHELKCDNRENKDWAQLFQVSIQHFYRTKTPREIIQELEGITPKYKETKILKTIMKMSAIFNDNYYFHFFELAKEAEKEILTIKCAYIRDSFTARLSETFSNLYLFARADVRKSRMYSEFLQNSPTCCAKVKSNSYYNMGVSFIFESYEDSLYYFNEYVKQQKEFGRHDRAQCVINDDIAFIKILWGQDVAEVETNDVLQLAFKEIRKGQKDNAVAILEQFNDKENPFYLCFLGMALEETNLLVASAYKFKNDGNTFFAKMAYNELTKYDSAKSVIPILSSTLNIA